MVKHLQTKIRPIPSIADSIEQDFDVRRQMLRMVLRADNVQRRPAVAAIARDYILGQGPVTRDMPEAAFAAAPEAWLDAVMLDAVVSSARECPNL